MKLQKFLAQSPGRTVLFSILLTILLGAGLLSLPACQSTPISFIDCVFTATSATCVTGVLTIPFDHFTMVGKCVILGLIQIGGIGLITLWMFLVALFVNLGISTHFMLSQILELSTLKNPRHILFFIMKVTLAVELLGTLAIYALIRHDYSPPDAWFHAIFHSISSFCNAGLSIFGQNSLVPFQTNVPLLAVTGMLILCGGIGFITLHELLLALKAKLQQRRFQFSLTTRVVLTATAVVIVIATALLMLLEGASHFPHSSWWLISSNMLFNAIAYRSTGLTTIALSSMQTATVFLIIMYSFIGSSPASTGSGIKVTTFALFLATIRAVIKGRMTVDIKGRRIPQDQIFKAVAVLSLGACWIVVSTFLLALAESQSPFMSVFFEAVSSFTNLGLATEITPLLSIPGKIIVILNMCAGRLGSMTLLLALGMHRERVDYQYPEERLMMG
jgi:trk system potassium uptake protein TrkH